MRLFIISSSIFKEIGLMNTSFIPASKRFNKSSSPENPVNPKIGIYILGYSLINNTI